MSAAGMESSVVSSRLTSIHTKETTFWVHVCVLGVENPHSILKRGDQ